LSPDRSFDVRRSIDGRIQVRVCVPPSVAPRHALRALNGALVALCCDAGLYGTSAAQVCCVRGTERRKAETTCMRNRSFAIRSIVERRVCACLISIFDSIRFDMSNGRAQVARGSLQLLALAPRCGRSARNGASQMDIETEF
jgi:hypothetical protein